MDINFDEILKTVEANGMRLYHFPILDFDAADLKLHIQDVCKLYKKLKDGHGYRVYVHCTAGMSRSVSVVVGYLCMYQGTSLILRF